MRGKWKKETALSQGLHKPQAYRRRRGYGRLHWGLLVVYGSCIQWSNFPEDLAGNHRLSILFYFILFFFFFALCSRSFRQSLIFTTQTSFFPQTSTHKRHKKCHSSILLRLPCPKMSYRIMCRHKNMHQHLTNNQCRWLRWATLTTACAGGRVSEPHPMTTRKAILSVQDFSA